MADSGAPTDTGDCGADAGWSGLVWFWKQGAIGALLKKGMAGAGLLLALFAGNAAADQIYYVHGDHLNVPNVVTNQDRQVVWEGHRKPFGETDVAVANIRQPFRFPGQYYDQETGLHYNLMRDYDPRLGRYVQSDPIGLDGGMSTYGYANQSPIMFVDPNGELAFLGAIPWFVGGGVSVGTIKSLTGISLLGLLMAMEFGGDASIRSSSQSEQCDNDDECKKLNNEVKSAKSEVGKLGKCLAGMSKWQLEVRRQAWLRLAQARSHRDSKCWAGGDDGHQEAHANAWQHVATCTALLGGA